MTEIILLINTIIINIYLFYFVQTQIEKSMELLIHLIFNEGFRNIKLFSYRLRSFSRLLEVSQVLILVRTDVFF